MNILFVDCLIRENDSRTKLIADAFFSNLDKMHSVKHVKIADLPLKCKDKNCFLEGYETDETIKKEAIAFKNADLIVVAAPFYDMGLPSILHVYCENISVDGITFLSSENSFKGNVKANEMIYIVTRGDLIEDESSKDAGTFYLKALGKLWGYKKVNVISAIGTDVLPLAEVNKNIDAAIKKAIKIAKKI